MTLIYIPAAAHPYGYIFIFIQPVVIKEFCLRRIRCDIIT